MLSVASHCLGSLRLVATSMVALCVVGLAACARPFAPPATSPPGPATVNQSFGRVWDATIDYLANNRIPIATIERASGVVVANVARVEGSDQQRRRLAHCGQRSTVLFPPTEALYNIVVRGDSTRSTVRANVEYRYASSRREVVLPCLSSGVWESDLQTYLGNRAAGLRDPQPSAATASSPPVRNRQSSTRAAPETVDASTFWTIVDTVSATGGRVLQVSRLSDPTTAPAELFIQCTERRVVLFVVWDRSVGRDSATVASRLDSGVQETDTWTLQGDGRIAVYRPDAAGWLRRMVGRSRLGIEVQPTGAAAIATVFPIDNIVYALDRVFAACAIK